MNIAIPSGSGGNNMKQIRILCLLVVVVFLNIGKVQALTVDPSSSAGTLASALQGSGILVNPSSAVLSSTATLGSSGTFSDGSIIGIESGVILSSGLAEDAERTNPGDTANTNFNYPNPAGMPGDSDLDSLLGAPVTADAASLTFNFEALADTILFNFVFASEEYNENVINSNFVLKNDVFGVFIKEAAAPASDFVNVAFVGNSDLPVSIGNVNNFVNSAYYFDNETSPIKPIIYDGLTVGLSAQIDLLSGNDYTIKFAIADGGFIVQGTGSRDPVKDAAVFIQAESYSAVIPEPSTMLLFGCGLLGLVGFKRKFWKI